jgi:hypothetical protein
MTPFLLEYPRTFSSALIVEEMPNRAAEVNRDTRMPDKAFRIALPPGTDLSSVSAYQETDFRGRLLTSDVR